MESKSNQMSRREFVQKTVQAGMAAAAATAFVPARAAENRSDHKICIFSKHLQWLDYESMGRTAAAIGFDGIDLTVRPGGHVLPENVERDLPKAFKAAQDSGVPIIMITTAITDVEDPLTERILKTAGQLGIPFYRTGWAKYKDNVGIPENLEHVTAQFKALAELNQKYNIRGGYQNHAGVGVGSPVWDIYMFLSRIQSEWMGSQYDVRHATVEGFDTWSLGLRLLSPYINTLDIKDFQWAQINGKWQAENVPLGQGIVDFQRYFAMLKELGLTKTPISMHFEYPMGGAEHGATQLTNMTPERVAQTMKRDLEFLQKHLA